MIHVKEYNRDISLRGYDYVFDKTRNYMRVIDYLTKRIDGRFWKVALLLPDYTTTTAILDTSVLPCVELTIFLDKLIYTNLATERPALDAKQVSKWEMYLELLKDLPKRIDDKAVSEIYKRCNKDINTIRDRLPEIIKVCTEDHVRVIDVDKVLVKNNITYASQVVEAFLLNSKNRWFLYNQVEEELGPKVTFFAIRKFLRKANKDKIEYLNNRETKLSMTSKVDMYSLAYFLALVEQAVSYQQLMPILYNVERRQHNDCSNKRAVISGDNKYYHTAR